MNRLQNEMQRYLQVIERAEADPEVWAKLTEGTGIATANGYRAALKAAADTNGANPHKDALELARTFIVSNVDSSLTAKVLPAIDRAIAAAAQPVAPEQAPVLRQQLRLSSAILQTLCKADLVREDSVFTIEGESYVFGDLMDKNDAAIGAASLSGKDANQNAVEALPTDAEVEEWYCDNIDESIATVSSSIYKFRLWLSRRAAAPSGVVEALPDWGRPSDNETVLVIRAEAETAGGLTTALYEVIRYIKRITKRDGYHEFTEPVSFHDANCYGSFEAKIIPTPETENNG